MGLIALIALILLCLHFGLGWWTVAVALLFTGILATEVKA